jgi:hypothetical protein
MSANEDPLLTIAAALDAMREQAIADAQPMLALLLQLARDEAKEELARRRRKPRPAKTATNVILFPTHRLAKRRDARALAVTTGKAAGELVRLADFLPPPRARRRRARAK